MSHFDDLFWLVAVVDEGTLSAAAEKHGVSGAAVSKRLRLLEERLAVRLLERNARRLRTTEAGELYYRRGKRLLEAFYELEENVSSTGELLRGTLRVNAPHSFGLQRLAAPVAEFMQEHPEVKVHIDMDDAFIDINESNYDVVIRIGRLEDSSVVARRIASINLVCCASPIYLKMHGVPKTPADLADHTCLIYNQRTPHSTWTFERDGQLHQVEVSGPIQSDNGQFLGQLTELGLGIVIQPNFIAEDALRSGTLVPLFTDYAVEEIGVYALYPSRQYLPVKTNRFINHLKSALSSGSVEPKKPL